MKIICGETALKQEYAFYTQSSSSFTLGLRSKLPSCADRYQFFKPTRDPYSTSMGKELMSCGIAQFMVSSWLHWDWQSPQPTYLDVTPHTFNRKSQFYHTEYYFNRSEHERTVPDCSLDLTSYRFMFRYVILHGIPSDGAGAQRSRKK